MKYETLEKRVLERIGLAHLIPEEPKPPTAEQKAASREAEAVIFYHRNPELFTEKICEFCEKLFMVDEVCVAYCSDECRIKRLAEIGIHWDPKKSQEERWSGPLVLPPELKDSAEYMHRLKVREKRLAKIPLVVGPEALNLLSTQESQTEQDMSQEFQALLDSASAIVSPFD